MPTSFRPGDLVRVRQTARTKAPGVHEVIAVVEAPGSQGRLYRVRGGPTASERTVEEKKLTKA
jgi:hypothetical protein